MKKLIMIVPLCVFMLLGIKAEDNELRKVSPSTVLQGMANSCGQLGKVAGAKDKKEKQKETCNLLASFFQLAADVSKEKKEKKEEKQKSNDQKEDMEEKKAVTDETINLALGVVNFVNDEEESCTLRSEPGIYLSILRDIPNDEIRGQLIEQILNDKQEASGFLEEIVNTLKNILFISIPEMTTNVSDTLKKFFVQ